MVCYVVVDSARLVIKGEWQCEYVCVQLRHALTLVQIHEAVESSAII